jgi:hypothetical protein
MARPHSFRWLANLMLLTSALVVDGPAWADGSRSSGTDKSLSAAAADPTEPLIQMSTDNDVAVSNRGGRERPTSSCSSR